MWCERNKVWWGHDVGETYTVRYPRARGMAMSEKFTNGWMHSLGAKGDNRLRINGLDGKFPRWHGVCNLHGDPRPFRRDR